MKAMLKNQGGEQSELSDDGDDDDTQKQWA